MAGVAAAGVVAGLSLNSNKRLARQALASLHGDWFGRLKAEHKLVRRLLKAMAATDFGEGARRVALVEKLSDILDRHALEEETVIYPALAAEGALVDHLFEDHGRIKLGLRRLIETAPEDPDWERAAKALRHLVEGHLRIEERDLFPLLHDRLGAEGNAKLTEQMRRQGSRIA